MDEPKNLFGVRSDRSPARRGHLFGEFDDAPGRGGRVQSAVLHLIERGRKGTEGFSVQLALLGGLALADPPEGGGRLCRPPGSHIARDSQNNVDAKGLQLGAVDGRECIESGLGRAGRPVEWKRQAGGPGADLHDSAARLPQCGKKGVHDGEGAEHVDIEFTPDGGERQNLQGPRRQNSSIADEKIEPASTLGSDLAGPTLDSGFVRDVTTGQGDSPAGRLLNVRDFPWRHRCSEDAVVLCCETERNVSPEPAARACHCGRAFVCTSNDNLLCYFGNVILSLFLTLSLRTCS